MIKTGSLRHSRSHRIHVLRNVAVVIDAGQWTADELAHTRDSEPLIFNKALSARELRNELRNIALSEQLNSVANVQVVLDGNFNYHPRSMHGTIREG